PSSSLVKGSSSHSTLPAWPKWAQRRRVLGAASAASSTSLAWRARQTAPTGSSPTSSFPAFRARPSRCRMGSLAIRGHLLHLRLQGLPNLRRKGGGEGPLQGLGLPGLGQAGRIGTHIGPPAGQLALEVQAHRPFGGADYPDELFFRFHLPTANALAHGYLLG